jgi:hypothetical protein
MRRPGWLASVGPVIAAAVVLALVAGREPRAQIAPEQPPQPAGVVLAEVLFNPRPGDVPFVELLNAGTAAVDVSRMALRLGEKDLLLRRVTEPLAANQRLVVLFDGGNRLEGRALHAADGFELDRDSGAVELHDATDRTVDRVAWGAEPDAVSTGTGIAMSLDIDPGSVIGRPPGANEPTTETAWVLYPAGSATPGAANPLPSVADLTPLDGAVVAGARADLSWEPMPGAASYRVQVAPEDGFASPVFDHTVAGPEAQTAALSPGRYAWRVQSVAADGTRSAFSAIKHLELQASGAGGPVAATFDSAGPPRVVRASLQSRASNHLNVPYLTQHKDSTMLQLENREYRGTHAWDVDHRSALATDPADAKNCVVANIAMINHFFGGDLTQDRIGYEVLSRNIDTYVPRLRAMFADQLAQDRRFAAKFVPYTRELMPGPERDLIYGFGLNGLRVTAALMYALQIDPNMQGAYRRRTDMWADVVREIGAGRPILAANTHHTFTITGYAERDGRRFVSVNDPARPGYREVDLESSDLTPSAITFWMLAPGAKGTMKEASLSKDSDGDGVNDFDEIERFKTNPLSRDTDGDGVEDKEDIASGVFEKEFHLGYAYTGLTGLDSGRDYDGDGLPTELDPDSDNGGCKDGEEDLDHNGFRTGKENSNFTPADDVCGTLMGSITYSIAVTKRAAGGSLTQSEAKTLTVTVALKQDPSRGPDFYVDNGSRFHFRRVAHLDINNPGCPLYGRQTTRGSGGFTGDAFLAAATASPTRLTVDFHGEVSSRTSSDSCLASGTSDEMDAFGSTDCAGVARRDGSPGRTYVFNCSEPASTNPEISIERWTASGTVRLR